MSEAEIHQAAREWLKDKGYRERSDESWCNLYNGETFHQCPEMLRMMAAFHISRSEELQRSVDDLENSYVQDEGIAPDGNVRALVSKLRKRTLRLRGALEEALDSNKKLTEALCKAARTRPVEEIAQRFCDSLFDQPLKGAMWADLAQDERASFIRTVEAVLGAAVLQPVAAPKEGQ